MRSSSNGRDVNSLSEFTSYIGPYGLHGAVVVFYWERRLPT
uniref:Uncharacterized protein n=1 Tax=uncultured bacterium contig00006 TaxID=1181498 RepID=A0A806JYF3_9BACT|nr:hypothetical protein [uncultured bacterium contig00006]